MKNNFTLLAILLTIFFGCDDGSPKSTPPGPKGGDAVDSATFYEMLGDPDMKLITLAGSADVTLTGGSTIAAKEFTIFVPEGATLRDYWNVGNGNTISVSSGGNLRWGMVGNNLLVGGGTTTANVRLTAGYLNLKGKPDDAFDIEQNGNVTVSKQGVTYGGTSTEWLDIIKGQTWTVKNGNMTVAAASGTSTINDTTTYPTMVVNGNLKIESEGSMRLLPGALVVIAGTASTASMIGEITVNDGGYVSNDGGTFNGGSSAANIVGFVDSDYAKISDTKLGQ